MIRVISNWSWLWALVLGLPEEADVRSKDYKRGTRAFCNGRDISSCCYRAEVYGAAMIIAECYKLDASGQFYWDQKSQDVAREVRIGFGFLEYPA